MLLAVLATEFAALPRVLPPFELLGPVFEYVFEVVRFTFPFVLTLAVVLQPVDSIEKSAKTMALINKVFISASSKCLESVPNKRTHLVQTCPFIRQKSRFMNRRKTGAIRPKCSFYGCERPTCPKAKKGGEGLSLSPPPAKSEKPGYRGVGLVRLLMFVFIREFEVVVREFDIAEFEWELDAFEFDMFEFE